MTTSSGPVPKPALPTQRRAPVAALDGAYWLDSPSRHEGEDCVRCAQLRGADPGPRGPDRPAGTAGAAGAEGAAGPAGPPEEPEPGEAVPRELGGTALRVVMTVLAVVSIVTALALTGRGR